MRETRSSGSVEGVRSNRDPYSDSRRLGPPSWNLSVVLNRAVDLVAPIARSTLRQKQETRN
jgi:hypothetical protein